MSKLAALKSLLITDPHNQNLYLDLVAEIVKEEMVEYLKCLENPDYDICETKKNKKRYRKAYQLVLEHYSTPTEYHDSLLEIYGPLKADWEEITRLAYTPPKPKR